MFDMYVKHRAYREPGSCDCSDPSGRYVYDHASGDKICTDCGVVAESHGTWAFEDPGRIAHERELLPAPAMPVTNAQRRYVEPDAHRSARAGLAAVERLAGTMGMSEDHVITSAAKELYRDLTNVRSIREDVRPAYVGCALYYGCKITGHKRSLKEIRDLCGADLHDAAKVYRSALTGKRYHAEMMRNVGSGDLLARALLAIQVSSGITVPQRMAVERRARNMTDEIRQRGLLEGKTPEAVSSAVLFASIQAEKLAVKKKHVYDACRISGVTMNKTLECLAAYKLKCNEA